MKRWKPIIGLEKELQGYTWSFHAYDKKCKVERIDNNGSELFNRWILPYKDMPILPMLEEIACRLIKRLIKIRNEANTWPKTIVLKIYK